MQKPAFSFLSICLLLAACAAPQAGTGAQALPTGTALATLTPVPTSFPLPTNSPMPTALSGQPGVLTLQLFQMMDANVGWGQGTVSYVGSAGQNPADALYLLRTSDGGETWQDVTPPAAFTAPRLFAISLVAVDADTAWAIPADYPFSEDPPHILVWRTTDGGKSWTPSNPLDISDSPILPGFSPMPQFVDKTHGWLTVHFEHRVNAYNLEYRTSDGGVTWEQTGTCSYGDGPWPGCDVPEFTDAQTAWLRNRPEYTSTGEVIPSTIWRVRRSLDAGQTWQTIPLPPANAAEECSQWPTRVAAGIVGIHLNCFSADRSEASYFYLSGDRGETWQIIPQPGDVYISFVDMTTGWRISKSDNGRQLERTTDGGLTWQKQADGLPDGGVQFTDANTGWIAVSQDKFGPIDLQRTTDGGKTWKTFTPRFVPAPPGEPALARMQAGSPLVLESVQMIDALNGWAIGGNGYVFYTSDGGRTWQDVTPLDGRIVPQRQFFALDAFHAWSTVSFPTYETIWSTADAGQTWHQIKALSERQTISPGTLRFVDANTGWFEAPITWSDTDTRLTHLIKTRDNGATWNVKLIGQDPSYPLFLDEKTGFRIEPLEDQTLGELLNDNPVLISKTTDEGDTWQPVNLPQMAFDADEISLDSAAYPGGIRALMQAQGQDTLSCAKGLSLRAFSARTIGLRVICKGAYREVLGTYGYVFVLGEYYLSTDGGATWNNWMFMGDDIPREKDWTPAESEFFLPSGTGWRLQSNQLLHTTDGGKTWTPLKAVGWDGAPLDFIDTQEGWGIAQTGHAIAFVHTTDGGKTWEEIKPVVAH